MLLDLGGYLLGKLCFEIEAYLGKIGLDERVLYFTLDRFLIG